MIAKTGWKTVMCVVVAIVTLVACGADPEQTAEQTRTTNVLSESAALADYTKHSEAQITDEISKKYPASELKTELEADLLKIRNKFKNSDLVEQVALERELASIQSKLDNHQQAYAEKVRMLISVFNTIDNLNNIQAVENHNQILNQIVHGNTVAADQLFANIESNNRNAKKREQINQVAEAVYQRGVIAEEALDYRKAYRYYRRAVQYNPDNIDYLMHAGVIADSIALYGNAVDYFEAALYKQLNQKDGKQEVSYSTRDILVKLGKSWSSKGGLSKAREFFELALEEAINQYGQSHVNIAEINNYLGSVLEQDGKIAESKSYYQRSLEMYKNKLGALHPATLLVQENLIRVSKSN